ncbi:MAG: hypothetical protein HY361_03145 [Candidatus Aenigmarchaeota archaeon]|nr:hypothetical protein [Candidatus Aenigmarchaeota archaeon]
MARQSNTRIELTKNQLIFVFAVAVLIIIAYFADIYIPKPIYSYDYHGIPLNFRADLREAAKVPIYPNDVIPYYELRGGLAKNITIVFQPVDGDNGIYSANGFEVSYKLGLLFNLLGRNVTIDAREIASYQHLPGKIQHPIIALVHPKFANETSVRLDGHVIFISGLPSNDVSNPYRNFDLATVRFLMDILDINV